MRTVIIIIVSVLWFPHSLLRVHDLGYDFTIFYQGISNPGWVYATWTTIFFEPLRLFPHDTAFAINYATCTLAYWMLVRHCHWMLFVLSFYPYLLSQELGAITPILAVLCFTFPGSLLAMCIKPYLGAFVIYHAIYTFRQARAPHTPLDADLIQDESPIRYDIDSVADENTEG